MADNIFIAHNKYQCMDVRMCMTKASVEAAPAPLDVASPGSGQQLDSLPHGPWD